MPVKTVLVKGGGDLGTGVALALHRHGYQVLVTELPQPLVVRRTVAMASAVYVGSITVEGITGRFVDDLSSIQAAWEQGEIPVLVDPLAHIREQIAACVIVDAILAKRNTGTTLEDAPIVIALGPGFQAGVDCHAVIETQRGPNLGRVLFNGATAPDSGIPGAIHGETTRRILRAPLDGTFVSHRKIGDHVSAGDFVAEVDGQPLFTSINGVIRGLLVDGLWVTRNLKVGDVDPRDDERLCYLLSDKACKMGQGVCMAVENLWV